MSDLISLVALLGILILGLYMSFRFGRREQPKEHAVEVDKPLKHAIEAIALHDPVDPLRLAVSGFPTFDADSAVLGIDSCVAFNEEGSAVLLVGGGRRTPTIVAAKDILECELLIDGHRQRQQGTAGQLQGSAIGGLQVGNVAAMGFDISGRATATLSARSVLFRISLNDIKQPIFDVLLYEKNRLSRQDARAISPTKALREGQILEARFALMMRGRDPFKAGDAFSDRMPGPSFDPSIISQLQELAKLLADNAITDTEYRALKERLLK